MRDAFLAPARFVAKQALDFALPPRCAGCGAVTPEPHRFCFDCWSRLDFLGEPCCECCGLPFAFAEPASQPLRDSASLLLRSGGSGLCGGCLAEPPAFDRMRAAVAYGEIARKVALKLKYGGRPGVAETIARMVERHVPKGEDGRAAPVFTPVPLHRWRIWRRGYNQAALIASALARRVQLPATLDLIQRVKATPPLRAMNPRQRRETVRGAFRIAERHKSTLAGRTIILVDDVFTTGATAHACAAALKRASAARVELLCWARVVKDGEPS
ncbi:MAG: ComF family protein [Sphingosinicella sp.]